MSNDADADLLASSFDNIVARGDVFVFAGGEEQMYAVLDFVRENKLLLRKIERFEPSLESIFVEVTGR